MSDQADGRHPEERLHGGDAEEFIGEEPTGEGFEGEHAEGARHGDTPEQLSDPGPM